MFVQTTRSVIPPAPAILVRNAFWKAHHAAVGNGDQRLHAFRRPGEPVVSPLAKVLSLNPFVPRIFAWSASSPASVEG